MFCVFAITETFQDTLFLTKRLTWMRTLFFIIMATKCWIRLQMFQRIWKNIRRNAFYERVLAISHYALCNVKSQWWQQEEKEEVKDIKRTEFLTLPADCVWRDYSVSSGWISVLTAFSRADKLQRCSQASNYTCNCKKKNGIITDSGLIFLCVPME